MDGLRLPSERLERAEFSITFTFAGNWKGRGCSLPLRTRGMQQHPFAGINPPLLALVWSHPYHLSGTGSGSYHVLQWQFQMFNCKRRSRLAQSHICQPWESTRIPAEQLGWEAGGMAEMILIHLYRTDSCGMDFDVRIFKLLAWDSSSRACETTVWHRSLVNKEGWRGKIKNILSSLSPFPVNTGSDWTN